MFGARAGAVKVECPLPAAGGRVARREGAGRIRRRALTAPPRRTGGKAPRFGRLLVPMAAIASRRTMRPEWCYDVRHAIGSVNN